MKAGYIQFAPVLNDLQQTLELLEPLLNQALQAGATLLVLPELCNSGYHFPSKAAALQSSETLTDSVFLQFLTKKCQGTHCAIVTGFNERVEIARAEPLLYNSAILVNAEGIMGSYRKMHLFMNEFDFFEQGNSGLPVFQAGDCLIGMLICFDWLFPEVWRALALQDVDIVCHPSNLVLPGFAQRSVPLHALMNRIFVITANRIGSERNLTFTGMSTIADPQGEILLQASPDQQEIGLVEINTALSRNKMITPRNHVLRDRRPEEYSLLTKA